jgi:ketosteroid isomerase-like protein
MVNEEVRPGMGPADGEAATVRTLVAVEEIRQLKARYFRLMDTKQWDDWAELFTEDCVAWVEDQPDVTYTSRDQFVSSTSSILADAVTTHHGHMPEITLDPAGDGERAQGIWAMEDYVQIPTPDGDITLRGYGHYHERYRRGSDGRWRIAWLRLERVRVDYL